MKSSKARVLVFDDEEIVLASIKRILEEEDFEIKICKQGQEALDLLESDDFDLLITDIKARGVDGFALLEKVISTGKDTSSIVITGRPSIETVLKAMKLGASDFLSKPFAPDKLAESVEKTLKDRNLKLEAKHRTETFEIVKNKVSSTLNIEQVLDTIVEGVVKAMKVKGCALSLLDRDQANLEIISYTGLSRDYVSKGPIDVSGNLSGTKISGQVIQIENVETDSRVQYPAEASREGISSILSMPLKVGGKIIGALRVYSGFPRVFTDDEISILQSFADQAAISIKNAISFEELKNEYDNLREDLRMKFDEIGWD